ncbi:MAG: hypothetical protein FWH32_08145 [Clostridiales bacterium]|nr:hypothetical protein [Clostridiales bacterium]
MSNNVIVTYGDPIMSPVLIPVEHTSTPSCICKPFMVEGTRHNITAMSFGSPHGALFVDDLEDVDVPGLGAALGTHALFPEGASIVFIQVLDKESIKARLWQRGEGEAAFTPEAACVAGTTSIICQKIFSDKVSISMGGNTYNMRWDRSDEVVTLTAPA